MKKGEGNTRRVKKGKRQQGTKGNENIVKEKIFHILQKNEKKSCVEENKNTK